MNNERKNQSYYSEIIDDHVIRTQSLLVSMETLDIVKDRLNKVLRSYQDLNRQFNSEEDKLNDSAYLRISSNVRDMELRVSKWIHDFNSQIERGSHYSHVSKSLKGSILSRKSNKSRIFQTPSSTLDDMI